MRRLAILPFENLSGDASLDWIRSAAPAILASELSGLAKVFPLRVENVSDAYRAQATHFVHGYFTGREPALRFEIELEDASRHKLVTTASTGGAVLKALDEAAKGLEAGAHRFSTSNADALAAWGRRDFERAVALDPDFGAAWLDWIRKLAAEGNPSQAVQVAGRALERRGLRSSEDRLQIEMASANLRAAVELAARNFVAAAAQYRIVLRADPANATAMNSLGYAEAFAGNLEASKKAFEEYGQQPLQKTNSLDSLGEAYFMNGRFKEAETYFLQAYQADAAFLGSAPLLKAAYARWLGGDLPGADATMKRYLEARAKLRDPLVAWREAVWDDATGRRELAMTRIQSAPRDLVEKQMAVWRGEVKPPGDIAVLEQIYKRTSPTADGEVRTFYAAALLAAGRKDEARKLLALWPLPTAGGDSLFQSQMFPKFQELRRNPGQ